MGAFRYLRPDKMATNGATVTDNGGTVDAAYQATWACDLRPGFPVMGTAGALALIAAWSSQDVDLVVASHLRVDEAVAITLSSGLTASLTGPGAQADGIPLNRYAVLAPAQTSTGCHLDITGNSVVPVLGEFFAGKSDTLSRRMKIGRQIGFQSFAIPAASEFSAVNPYDKGLAGELWQGQQYYDDDEVEQIRQWYKSTRDGTLPTVVIPDDAKPECHVVLFSAPPQIQEDQGMLNLVSLTFQEIPRQRW